MVKKNNNWNLQEMQDTLVRDTENRINQGFENIASNQRLSTPQSVEYVAVSQQQKNEEPTKGVQTYIPMSTYRRLNDIKLTRRENIASLVAQAIDLWLDVQEGRVATSRL